MKVKFSPVRLIMIMSLIILLNPGLILAGKTGRVTNSQSNEAPLVPNVTAVVGNNVVTLFWDDIAEDSDDPVLGKDFEGYRIYRSTDTEWNDMAPITDSKGSVVYRKPLVQFDLDNDINGYSPTPIRGAHYYLGDDTGLVHVYIDSTAKNGYTYYYAVTSYDRGDPVQNIAPSECPKYLMITTSGRLEMGPNVVMVRPEAPVAGYKDPVLANFALLTQGTTTGTIGYEIIDPAKVPDKHTYRITFTDTLDLGADPETRYTKTFSLEDVTDLTHKHLIDQCPLVNTGDVTPIVDGFRLTFNNPPQLEVNTIESGWNRATVMNYSLQPQGYPQWKTEMPPIDYLIVFGAPGMDSTDAVYRGTVLWPALPVNCTIKNMATGARVPFTMNELDGKDRIFSGYTAARKTKSDVITILTDASSTLTCAAWELSLVKPTDETHTNPGPGDSLRIVVTKPMLSNDVFEFTTTSAMVSAEKVKTDLDRIKIVPNPYVVSNSWEPVNPNSSGRGLRQLHFNHLPEKCTIKIFNVRGQLIKEIEHNSPSWYDGTEIWDMQTKDNLDISYGVYIYHIDAAGIGQKVGKFAIIK